MKTHQNLAALSVAAFLTANASLSAAVTAAGLIQDLDADAGVTLNGSNVSAWANQAGSGGDDVSQATAANQPALLTSVAGINNHNAVALTTTDFLAGTSTVAFDSLISGGGYTWLAVVRVDAQSGVAKNAVFGTLLNSSPFSGITGGVNGGQQAMALTRPSGEIVVAGGAALNDGAYHIIAGRLSAGTGTQTTQVFADGPAVLSSNSNSISGTGDADGISIGRERTGNTGTGGQAFEGDLARLLIYNRPLTDEELNETGFALAQTYGLTTTFVPEPSTSLFAIAGLGVAFLRRRRA